MTSFWTLVIIYSISSPFSFTHNTLNKTKNLPYENGRACEHTTTTNPLSSSPHHHNHLSTVTNPLFLSCFPNKQACDGTVKAYNTLIFFLLLHQHYLIFFFSNLYPFNILLLDETYLNLTT